MTDSITFSTDQQLAFRMVTRLRRETGGKDAWEGYRLTSGQDP
jgi:hypothetical protein